MLYITLCNTILQNIEPIMKNGSWKRKRKRREGAERGNTVEPPNKGHFGANSFVPCREVVPISEGPLLEVPL